MLFLYRWDNEKRLILYIESKTLLCITVVSRDFIVVRDNEKFEVATFEIRGIHYILFDIVSRYFDGL